MHTPQEYIDNLKNGIITQPMLEDALYSVNKRAKNYRDSKRTSCSVYRDDYLSSEKKETEMYARKKILLSILKPVCIHKELVGYKKDRIYEYNNDYKEIFIANAVKNNIVWENSYVDGSSGRSIEFFDIYKRNQPAYNYYLFYMTGNHSFHTPIQVEDIKKYNLPVYEIGTLKTYGKDTNELLSIQFVDQIIDLIKTGNFSYRQVEIAYKDQENELPDGLPLYEVWQDLMSFVINEIRDRLLRCCKSYELSLEQKRSVEAECRERLYKLKCNKKPLTEENCLYELIKSFVPIYIPYSKELEDKLREYDPLTETDLVNEVVDYYKNNAEKICKDNLIITAENQYLKNNYKNWL